MPETPSPAPLWRRLAALVLAVAQDTLDVLRRPLARVLDQAEAGRLERSARLDLELAQQARDAGVPDVAARLDALAVATLRRLR